MARTVNDKLVMKMEASLGFSIESVQRAVENNKHNHLSATYYLLLKKKERVTGKNYVYEQVTFDKKKTLYSTSNLKGNFSKGFDMSLNSTQKLFGASYCRSEGRQTIENRDQRSSGSNNSTAQAGVHKRADSTIHKRVADIISMPSKAITPSNNKPIHPV